MQAETWTLDHPMPVPDRQEVPHPHEAILDPTGQFLIVPDLGADLVRIFHVNATSLKWTPVAPIVAPPGSGPRHAAFIVAGDKTLLYLVSELANTITGYEVVYNKNATLSFNKVYLSSSHGPGVSAPAGAAAAEILASVSSSPSSKAWPCRREKEKRRSKC